MATNKPQNVVASKMNGNEGWSALQNAEAKRQGNMATAWGITLLSVTQKPFDNSILFTLEFDIASQPEARIGNQLIWRLCKASFPSMYNQKQNIDIVDGRKVWLISWFINFNVAELSHIVNKASQ